MSRTCVTFVGHPGARGTQHTIRAQTCSIEDDPRPRSMRSPRSRKPAAMTQHVSLGWPSQGPATTHVPEFRAAGAQHMMVAAPESFAYVMPAIDLDAHEHRGQGAEPPLPSAFHARFPPPFPPAPAPRDGPGCGLLSSPSLRVPLSASSKCGTARRERRVRKDFGLRMLALVDERAPPLALCWCRPRRRWPLSGEAEGDGESVSSAKGRRNGAFDEQADRADQGDARALFRHAAAHCGVAHGPLPNCAKVRVPQARHQPLAVPAVALTAMCRRRDERWGGV